MKNSISSCFLPKTKQTGWDELRLRQSSREVPEHRSVDPGSIGSEPRTTSEATE